MAFVVIVSFNFSHTRKTHLESDEEKLQTLPGSYKSYSTIGKWLERNHIVRFQTVLEFKTSSSPRVILILLKIGKKSHTQTSGSPGFRNSNSAKFHINVTRQLNNVWKEIIQSYFTVPVFRTSNCPRIISILLENWKVFGKKSYSQISDNPRILNLNIPRNISILFNNWKVFRVISYSQTSDSPRIHKFKQSQDSKVQTVRGSNQSYSTIGKYLERNHTVGLQTVPRLRLRTSNSPRIILILHGNWKVFGKKSYSQTSNSPKIQNVKQSQDHINLNRQLANCLDINHTRGRTSNLLLSSQVIICIRAKSELTHY